MQKKRIALFSCAALVAVGIGLNIQNAIADYGIGDNSFSLVAVGGSNSGSNSNLNWNSNTDIMPDISDSDSNDNGKSEEKKIILTRHSNYPVSGAPGEKKKFKINDDIIEVTCDENGKASIPLTYIECPPGGNQDCTPTSCPAPVEL